MLDSAKVLEKKHIALTSVFAAIFLTGIKLIVGIETNSLGILSEAAHSALDLLAALLTYGAVRIADRPPDRNHQYGHGKIENVSALFQTVLLIFTCAWIVWEAIERLVSGTIHVEVSFWSFAVMVVSIIVDVSRSRALYRVARKHNSQALEADALHFSSDVWSSLVVIVGLVFVSFGFPMVDAVSAIGVALLVLFVSYRLGRRTIDALMDKVPGGLYEELLGRIERVEGVEEIRSIRLRPSGAKVFVDCIVAISRTTPFHQAHQIMDEVEAAVRVAYPEIDVVVHAEPFESENETIADKIRMIVLAEGHLAPHNLEILLAEDKYHIDFDLEYRKGHSFADAHELASVVEQRIREQIPSAGRVTIHMEEYELGAKIFKDLTYSETSLREQIRACVMEEGRISACSEVALLGIDDRYNASITCSIEKQRSLAEVHDIVSLAEGALYQRFKQLRRVTIHAEPK